MGFSIYTCFEDSFETFRQIVSNLFQEEVVVFKPTIERSVVLLYDRTSETVCVNGARMELFVQKERHIDHIPPTSAALMQPSKRPIIQAGYIWGQYMAAEQDTSLPRDLAWTKSVDDKWIPLWSTLPEAAKYCSELIRYSCKVDKGCSCKCSKSNLKCTALCKCNGDCEQ